MDSFRSYMLRIAYQKVAKLGDRLAKADTLIDWEAFRPIIKSLYTNQRSQGGRPNLDEVMMVKLLVIQQWYGLSDPELERQVADRISFQRFLGFPEEAPDYSTVWQLRERLAETGKDREVWAELQRQLDAKGVRVRKGVA
jgi:IS5 family transposase